MPKKLDVGAAILAEYVAQGAANKVTIVNAYSGNVIVGEIPSDIGFGLYLEMRFKEGGASPTVAFEMLVNEQLLFRGNAGGQIPRPGEPATIIVQHFAFPLTTDTTTLELYVSAEGYARTLAMLKTITKGAIPSG